MRYVVLLAPVLFTIMFISDVHLAMATNHVTRRPTGQKSRLERVGQPVRSAWDRTEAPLAADSIAMEPSTHRSGEVATAVPGDMEAPLGTSMDLSSWRPFEEPLSFSSMIETSVGTNGEGVADLWLVEDEPDVPDDGNETPRALARDWRGLERDTAFFLGYEVVAAGILYVLPESVTKWTAEQRKTSLQRWWDNVRHPQWDKDTWYVNYLGHPYFGAIAYTRARERQFGAFGGFSYAALISSLYEFGIEALFERPSYQDLIVTPAGGLLIGALLFEPIRDYIKGKPELHWYDHVALAVTDPLGTGNSIFERLFGLQTDIRVQFHLSDFAPYAPLNEPTVRSLDRPLEQHRPSPGIGIEFVFGGRKRWDQPAW